MATYSSEMTTYRYLVIISPLKGRRNADLSILSIRRNDFEVRDLYLVAKTHDFQSRLTVIARVNTSYGDIPFPSQGNI